MAEQRTSKSTMADVIGGVILGLILATAYQLIGLDKYSLSVGIGIMVGIGIVGGLLLGLVRRSLLR